MTDYTTLITSEHSDKPSYMAMVALVTGALADITAAVQSIPPAFDLDNAVGVQLDTVGLWVGQPRLVADVLDIPFFGFSDNPSALPFGELGDPSIGGRFYELGEPFSDTAVLADPEYRTIIRAKIVRNQWNGLIDGLEQALSFIFGTVAWVTDTGTLNLTITIGRPITIVEQTLLSTFDILPRPAGVKIGTIKYVTTIDGDAIDLTSATGHL